MKGSAAFPGRTRMRMDSLKPITLVLQDLYLAVTPNYDNGSLSGMATLTLRNEGQKPVDIVPLQLGRLMHVLEVSDGAGDALEYNQDIVVYSDEPRLQVNQFRVTLNEQLHHGSSARVRVKYTGVLVGYTEVGWRYVRDHVNREFTILREDAFAFPVLGNPSMAARRATPSGEFTFSAEVTVPDDLVVSLGTAESEIRESEGKRTWVFRSEAAIPFLNIAIGQYVRITERGITVSYFKEDAEGAQRLLSVLHRVIDKYNGWFGALKERPEFSLTEIPEGWGSQSSLTAGVILTSDSFKVSRAPIGLYHELAHLWHPHTLDFPSSRWTEGFATFLQYRMAQDLGEADLDERVERVWHRLADEIESDAKLESVPMIDYGKHLLTDSSYTVGCCLFYALYAAIGERQFDGVLGKFFNKHREDGATTEDFKKTIVASGGQTEQILERWLYSTEWAELRKAGVTFREAIESFA